jgi:prepilin-type processing-associated H-X9-DG protein
VALFDDFDLGWISGTSSTLRNTGSPLNGQGSGAFGAALLSGPPWIYTYGKDETAWGWEDKQFDPATGEFVEVDPATLGAEAGAQPANETNEPPVADEPAEANQIVDQSPVAPADAPQKTDPELKPDKDGLLRHSKLGGNGKAPLAVGGFASSHMGGVNFAFGDGSVRFVADDATAGLMGRLANRADGNIVDAREMP